MSKQPAFFGAARRSGSSFHVQARSLSPFFPVLDLPTMPCTAAGFWCWSTPGCDPTQWILLPCSCKPPCSRVCRKLQAPSAPAQVDLQGGGCQRQQAHLAAETSILHEAASAEDLGVGALEQLLDSCPQILGAAHGDHDRVHWGGVAVDLNLGPCTCTEVDRRSDPATLAVPWGQRCGMPCVAATATAGSVEDCQS